MQAGIAVILLLLTWLSRGDARSMALYLATLIVPAGWSYGFWTGHQREEAARAARSWTPEMAKAERKRGFGILGGAVTLWVAVALAIVLIL